MPNPIFIQKAKKWMNKDIPVERTRQNPKQKSPLSASNVSYSFLEGIEGERILREYKARVSGSYQNASALNNLSFSDNVVKGSNPFSFVLLNQILREEGMWVARPADLERCLRENALNLKDTYGDSALVLISNGDPNEYLAKQLETQISQRGNLQYPTMVPLTEFDLEFNPKSPYKLSFKLMDSAELIYAPQFEHKNDGAKFNNADAKGLPIFDKNGSRTLYTGEGGLRRLYRYRYLLLFARYWNLASDDAAGRVIVCREATHTKN